LVDYCSFAPLVRRDPLPINPIIQNPVHPSPELLAPAGDWDCARAAVANGADAVYFGLPRFNARLRAENFREEELEEVVGFCHRHGVKAYVAMNTLIFTGELSAAEEELRRCNRAGVDALIVQDVGLVQLARAVVPELAIHASTQMTITSPAGAALAREMGVERVVLARELSLRELEKFGESSVPVEVFVHGALCVAYSGQCLTSESLGRRSANRGECAQACRMPYELVVDGAVRELGDRRYLLSPQDLAAVEEIPALLERGVVSFKIEGRLKAPEYVAAVCQVYRKALDAALAGRAFAPAPADRYQLEMTFSRGLFSGWLHGVDHQRLVPARYGKKRGPFAGRIVRVGRDYVELAPEVALAAGDGVVFDTGGDTNTEQGGRIFERKGQRFFFQHGHIDFSRLHAGDRVWKTGDPVLAKNLRQTFTGQIPPRRRAAIELHVRGKAGEPMELESGGVRVSSKVPLQAARTAPLTEERLREHLGRFGEAPFALGDLHAALEGEVILPIGELNRLRRELAFALEAKRAEPRPERAFTWRELAPPVEPVEPAAPELSVLCRSDEQAIAAVQAGARTIYLDYEDIRRSKEGVALVREAGPAEAWIATPRIQKAGEEGFFRLIENAAPDGVLIRNLGAIEFWRDQPMRRRGDFSLNVANPISANYFRRHGLERLTVSYDLNVEQVLELLAGAPPGWFELTLHQHMPMFHMEHCVFAAFMSKGSSFLDCGRPCEKHRVSLRDRVGMEHPLRADVGCRNTLFNAVPQTGARFAGALQAAGLRQFRVELLSEDAAETGRLVRNYLALLSGEVEGETLLQTLKARSQLGVTHGTLQG
jgi:putative protease